MTCGGGTSSLSVLLERPPICEAGLSLRARRASHHPAIRLPSPRFSARSLAWLSRLSNERLRHTGGSLRQRQFFNVTRRGRRSTVLSTGRGVRGKGSPMSSTKLYDESAMTSSEGDDDKRHSAAVEARRRYLMRYVVAVIGFSATICLAAGVRMAVARPGSADNASPPAP